MKGQTRRNWNAANARRANEPFADLFDAGQEAEDPAAASAPKWNVGDAVQIFDGSDAHGDTGAIWAIQDNGLILVELEECLWPVNAEEIQPAKETPTP